jgi:hypothetical protein
MCTLYCEAAGKKGDGVRRWQFVILAWIALLGSGHLFLRYIWLRRRRLPSGLQYLPRADAGQLAMSHLQLGHSRLVVVVHDGLDTLVRRQESDELFATAMPPKDWLYIPGAPHAWPMASAREVIAWLEKNMREESVI